MRVFSDERHGEGPLAGIATALAAAEGKPVLVVAWDMPFVTDALLASLRQRGERGTADIVAPSHTTPRGLVHEALCAYYAPAALPVCHSLLDAGERRAGALLEIDRAERVGDAELARFGDAARLFTSVDTPEVLAALGGTMPEPG